jgi:hypothetical protein
MRYLLYLILLIPIQVVTWIITPALPLFSELRYGGLNNNHIMGIGLRLPVWLSWFDTRDNSLLGDSKWQVQHSGTYWNQVCWLYRNSLYGFKWTVLSLPEGHSAAWQWHKKFYYGGYYLDLNFGWMLDNIENGRVMFHFSPRLKRVVWTN